LTRKPLQGSEEKAGQHVKVKKEATKTLKEKRAEKKDQESREEQIKIVRPGLSIIKRGSRQPLLFFFQSFY
jgi:hypothetical protein